MVSFLGLSHKVFLKYMSFLFALQSPPELSPFFSVHSEFISDFLYGQGPIGAKDRELE